MTTCGPSSCYLRRRGRFSQAGENGGPVNSSSLSGKAPMPKCKRYVEEEKAKCGRPAKKRFVEGQLVGRFCDRCFVVTIKESPQIMIKRAYRDKLHPAMRLRAMALVKKEATAVLEDMDNGLVEAYRKTLDESR